MTARYTVAARADLAGIYRYTLFTWGEAQAERYIAGLESAVEGIVDGSSISRPVAHRNDLRTVKQSHHLVVYRPDDGGSPMVVRVLHERMDIDRHLDEPPSRT